MLSLVTLIVIATFVTSPDTTNVILEEPTVSLNSVVQNEKLLREILNVYYNNTELFIMKIETIQDMIQENTKQLKELKKSAFTVESIVLENKGLANNILDVVLNDIQNRSSVTTSCQYIKENRPNSPSGYYHINGEVVYCEMGELCGSEGGWSRLAYLNMSDSTVDCPTGFRLYENEIYGIRACGRSYNRGASCASVEFSSNNISYSEVCGRVVGYQYGSPDAVDTRFVSPEMYNDINNYNLC